MVEMLRGWNEFFDSMKMHASGLLTIYINW